MKLHIKGLKALKDTRWTIQINKSRSDSPYTISKTTLDAFRIENMGKLVKALFLNNRIFSI